MARPDSDTLKQKTKTKVQAPKNLSNKRKKGVVPVSSFDFLPFHLWV
jgi:hypothetical protein